LTTFLIIEKEGLHQGRMELPLSVAGIPHQMLFDFGAAA